MMVGDKTKESSTKEKRVRFEDDLQTSDQQDKELETNIPENEEELESRSASDNENSDNLEEKEFDPDANRKKKRKIVPYTQQQIKRQLKLLKYSEHYLYFLRPQDHPELQAELDKLDLKNNITTTKKDGRNRDPNRNETLSSLDDELEGKVMHFESTPPFVDSQYSMRDYQIDGLNWLIRMYADGMNGILADEMGLGKTFQVISLLSYLSMYENIKGPHLIVCPKSVCRNWAEEFDKWVPGMFRVKILEGEKEVRKALVKQLQENPDSYDVIISSPELAVIEHAFLRKRKYIYTILDEAHRIKNANAKFTLKLKEIECDHSLLITGTPLQNNLDELWSLLNFISRDVFSDHEDFQYWLTNQSDENSAIEKLKMIISPFILRRIKMEVEKSLLPKKVRQIYTGLSAVQKKLYKDLLSNDIQLINDHKNAKNSATSLHNLLMQLRKCVNHPYIFRHIEPQPYVEGEHLVEVCGKLTVLDKLLKHWKANGDRVLIFSQMLGFLDIFEDYCIMRGYKYCRIDGATEHELRVSQIKEYNAPDSDKFIFLLSTKAAGQGINLATANIVVIYDLDWNPQVDLQAMDRAHRIGQKKQVYVYQFITEDSIEEKVLEKATKKLKLDQMVIQKKLVNTASTKVSASDMLTTVRHGAKEILEGEGKSSIRNDTIEEILAKSEARSQKFEQEMASVGYNELISLSEQSINLDDERNRHNVSIKNAGRIFLAPGSRQRSRKEVNYSEISKPKAAPIDYSKYDFRFYPQELHVFYEKENDYYLKCYPDLIPSHILPGTVERTKIMQSRPLTDEEEIKKQEYIKQGFNSWSRKDYQLVIKTVKDPFFYDIDYLFDKFKDSEGKITKTKKEIHDYFYHLMKNCDKLQDYQNVRAIFKDWIDRNNSLNQNSIALKKLENEFYKPSFQNPFKFIQKFIKSSKFTSDQQLSLCLLAYEIGLKSPDLYSKLQNSLIDHPDFIGCWGICSLSVDSLKRHLNEFLTALNEQKETVKNAIEKVVAEKAQSASSSVPATPTIANFQSQTASSTPKSTTSNVQSTDNVLKNINYALSRATGNTQNLFSATRRLEVSTQNPTHISAPASQPDIRNNAQEHARSNSRNPQPAQSPIQNIDVTRSNPDLNRNIPNSRQKSIPENYSASSYTVHDARPDIIQKLQYMQNFKRNLANSNINIDMSNPLFAQRQVSQPQHPSLPQTTLYSPTITQGFTHAQAQPMPSYPHISASHNGVYNQPPPQLQAIPHHNTPHNQQAPFQIFNPYLLQQAYQNAQATSQRDAHARLIYSSGASSQYPSAPISRPHQFSQQMALPNASAIYQRPIAPFVVGGVANRPIYTSQVAHPQSIPHNQQAPAIAQHINARFTASPQVAGSRSHSLSNQSLTSVPRSIRPSPETSDSHYHNIQYQAKNIQQTNTIPESGNPMLIQTSNLNNSINYQPSPISVPQGYSINLKSAARETQLASRNAQSGDNTPTQPDFIQSFSSPRPRSATPKSVADQSPNPNQS